MECSNSKDRSLFDEHIVKCLQRWFGIANELGLLSVPIYGTLIASYYRNATILKWEKDIDLCKIETLCQVILSGTYMVFVLHVNIEITHNYVIFSSPAIQRGMGSRCCYSN